MNHSLESVVRFVNLTASGLLAGSLGFGRTPLVPGWEQELPASSESKRANPASGYFNAIGPIALATSVTLVVGSRGAGHARRTLDVLSTLSLAGVVAATTLGTVPLNRKMISERPLDYPSDDTQALAKNWNRAHALRLALGVSAFVCAVASTVIRPDGGGRR
ncbi:MAG: DUF1772 domain-containing protein [Thermoanaerobaculia bacterium]